MNKEKPILVFGLQADVQYTPDLKEGHKNHFFFLFIFFLEILNFHSQTF